MDNNMPDVESKQLQPKMPPKPTESSETLERARKVGLLTQMLQVNRKAYDLAPMDDDQLKLYISDLWRYSPEEVGCALAQCRRTVKYGFPKIADVVLAIEGSAETAQLARARIAWDKAQDIAKRFVQRDAAGRYRLTPSSGPARKYICEDDPTDVAYLAKPIPIPAIDAELEHAVRLCGGWERLKDIDEKDFPFVQRDFFEHYSSFKDVEKQRALIGADEANRLLAEMHAETKQVLDGLRSARELKG